MNLPIVWTSRARGASVGRQAAATRTCGSGSCRPRCRSRSVSASSATTTCSSSCPSCSSPRGCWSGRERTRGEAHHRAGGGDRSHRRRPRLPGPPVQREGAVQTGEPVPERGAGPEDRILVWGHVPEIYWASGKRPATLPHVRVPLRVGARPPRNDANVKGATPGAWELFFEDFAAHPPTYILDTATRHSRCAVLHDRPVFGSGASCTGITTTWRPWTASGSTSGGPRRCRRH